MNDSKTVLDSKAQNKTDVENAKGPAYSSEYYRALEIIRSWPNYKIDTYNNYFAVSKNAKKIPLK